MEDLKELRKKRGEDITVFSEMTQTGVLNYILLFASGQFIDWENGECIFQDRQLIHLQMNFQKKSIIQRYMKILVIGNSRKRCFGMEELCLCHIPFQV